MKSNSHSDSMWRGADPMIFKNAQDLRKQETETEQLLWKYLKGKQMCKCKFRRQHPIQHYVADFFCSERDLVIEIDGGYHVEDEQRQKDIERENDIVLQGFTVLRFTNEEVLDDIQFVLDSIEEVLLK